LTDRAFLKGQCRLRFKKAHSFQESMAAQARLLLGYTNNNDQLKDDAIVRKTACLRQKGVGVAVV